MESVRFGAANAPLRKENVHPGSGNVHPGRTSLRPRSGNVRLQQRNVGLGSTKARLGRRSVRLRVQSLRRQPTNLRLDGRKARPLPMFMSPQESQQMVRHPVRLFRLKPMPAVGEVDHLLGTEAFRKARIDVGVLIPPEDERGDLGRHFEQPVVPALEILRVRGAIEPQNHFLRRGAHEIVGPVHLRARQLARSALELAGERPAARQQLAELSQNRRAPDAPPEMPVVIGKDRRIQSGDAADFFGVADRPGEAEDAAEVVDDQVHGLGQAHDHVQLIDKPGEAFERAVEVGRCRGVAEGRQVWSQAAIVRAEPVDDAGPDFGRVRVAMEEQRRHACPLVDQMDARASDGQSHDVSFLAPLRQRQPL